ncbi:MAG: hypothetical protein A2X64_10390 [Ignavibacteria bacterium GWF2_33_9]|nr:MAG: hypothetical protein A2X64_10390 [Ignavibacteria bacterium GWF2_33_9]
MKNTFTAFKKYWGILAILFITLIFTQSSAFSQCSYCSATTTYEYEGIKRVEFGDIDNTTGWGSSVQNYTSQSTDVVATIGTTMKITNLNAYYADLVYAYIDMNHNCTYDANEAFSITSSDDGATFSGTITVPTTALPGSTTMRIRLVDVSSYPYSFIICGSVDWGETEEYSVNIKLPAPDAAITEIITPTYPYNEGNYPISMKLANLGLDNLIGCTINWSVNGVEQNPYYWSGNLSQKDNPVQIQLGNYDFIYPDGSNFDPFTIRVWLTDIKSNGGFPDSDPSNHDKETKTNPSTEDVAAMSISQPSSSFVPGPVQIAVTIQNNARKLLTSCYVDWYVDGTLQGSQLWFGSLAQGETAEVIVGTYNFYFKTPLAPFTIDAETRMPNGVDDPITSNDACTRNVAPSLVAGTFYVGGPTAHFPKLADAVSYLNASGIIGDGDVYLKFNNGTYNEQGMFLTFPHGNNHFYFESASGNPSDVTLSFATNTMYNYILGFDGMNNVTIRNLTFNASNGGAGTNVAVYNGYDFTFNNVRFNGIYNTSNSNYSLVRFENTSDASFTNCTFYGGYNGIDVLDYINLTVNSGTFTNYGHYGVYQEAMYEGYLVSGKLNQKNKIQSAQPIEITNSTFNGMGQNPHGGIRIMQPAFITDNYFANFSSSVSEMAAIVVESDGSEHTLIKNNEIEKLNGVTGIAFIGDNANITENSVSTSSDSFSPLYGIFLQASNVEFSYNNVIVKDAGYQTNGIVSFYSNGVIANNLIVSENGPAFTAIENSGLGAFYNTLISNYDGQEGAANFNYGYNSFMRNIVMNYGTGHSVTSSFANVNSGENIFLTRGNTNDSDLNSWITNTGDQTSSNAAIELSDDGKYLYSKFQEPALTDYPLGIGPLEAYDYYGMERAGWFYAGYAGITLEITINEQPKPILACVGDENQELYASAKMNYGVKPSYQWQKDGVNIPGADKPIYRITEFTYETTGIYRCLIYGPANTSSGVFTNDATVYTLSQTEITRQPVSTEAEMGGTVFFEVEVHIKGIVAPYFQHKYQWWRHVNNEDVQLMDNDYFANTKSPIMTITNLQDLHFSGEDDYYYCVIQGQCGEVTTENVTLGLVSGSIVINTDPIDQTSCIGSTTVFTCEASVVGSQEILTYQWFQGGVALVDDARIIGSTTNMLTIANAAPTDETTYYCEVYATESGQSAQTEVAMLTIEYPATIDVQPEDQTIKESETVSLFVGASGYGTITYQWYFNDAIIGGANTPDFEIVGATIDNSGFYYCAITNECGTINSTTVQVIVEKDGGTTSITDANAIQLQVTPNPAISDINVNFTLADAANVQINIIDMTGRTIAMKDVNAVSGLNTVKMNLGHKVASGSYFIQVTYNNETYTQQIVVNK